MSEKKTDKRPYVKPRLRERERLNSVVEGGATTVTVERIT